METEKRGRGRPPLPEGQRMGRLYVNVPRDRIAALHDVAAERGGSLSDLVREIVDEWFAARQGDGTGTSAQ
jgi:hypothetical protein